MEHISLTIFFIILLLTSFNHNNFVRRNIFTTFAPVRDKEINKSEVKDMDKTISYVMNTVVGKITSVSEFMNIVSDYDYCQFGIDRGEGDFFFFELKIKELYNKGR